MKVKRALSVSDVLNYRPRTMEFEGRWYDSFGCPEIRGCWLIWGSSGSGKTRFALQLCKYLTKFGRVAYDSLEEGLSATMQAAFEDEGMLQAKRKFIFLDREPVTVPHFWSAAFKRKVVDYLQRFAFDDKSSRSIAEVLDLLERYKPVKKSDEITCLIDRLERRKSPDIIVIDSLQYSTLNMVTTKDLTTSFPNKLFIFISHADGQNPAGRSAKSVLYDADLKLRVVGRAIPEPISRFKRGRCERFEIDTIKI